MKKELIRVVQLAQSGNEEAFQQLYQQFYKQAYGTALIYCKNDADAKDVVQDAFYSIHKALPKLRNPEIFDYWMTRIIRTKCIKLFSRNKDIFMDDEKLRAIPNKYEVRKDYIPYEYTAENEEKELMHHFVDQLSQKQKICIELFYFDQMNLEEISKILKISVGTVKSRLFGARKLLKKYITSYEGRQDVKVAFRMDTILPLTFFTILQKGYLVKKVTSIKEHMQQNSLAMNTMIAINVAATMVLVGAIGTGGVILAQEGMKQGDLGAKKQMDKFVPSYLQQSYSDVKYPVVNFKGKAYKTPKAMYYAILAWYQKSGSATLEETEIIKEMYQIIKNEKGEYWDLLEKLAWSKQLENL